MIFLWSCIYPLTTLGRRMRKSKNSSRKSVNNETDSQTRSVSTLLERNSAMNTASIVRYTVLPGVLPTMACREAPARGEQALGVQKGREICLLDVQKGPEQSVKWTKNSFFCELLDNNNSNGLEKGCSVLNWICLRSIIFLRMGYNFYSLTLKRFRISV